MYGPGNNRVNNSSVKMIVKPKSLIEIVKIREKENTRTTS